MATLLLKSADVGERVFELHLGTNRVGRSPDCDFQIEHPAVSALHCELVLTAAGVTVRDCDSTNGTYLDTLRISESALRAGQILRLGDVELLVESVEATVAIPDLKTTPPGPPIVLQDGTLLCPRHPQSAAEFQCTHCREVLCTECVHRLRRRGGKSIALCPLCSHRCERISPTPQPKKKTFMSMLQRTIRLPLLGKSKK